MIYTPPGFENLNLEQLHKLIDDFNFATLVSQNGDDFTISHVPMLLDRNQGQYGTLKWHLAKQNPHAEQLNGQQKVLCIFHGPHAYISHNWYKTKPSVPTWNYVVVHAHGIPTPISKQQLSLDLTELVNRHETSLNQDNNYAIPEIYKEKLLEQIVGFSMPISELHGKFKLGQNRSQIDQQSFIEALQQQKNSNARELAEFIRSLAESAII